VIEVGNLSPARDFSDVRDVMAAYHLALTQGRPGDVFNICSGQAHTIQEVLDILLSNSTAAVEVRVDPSRLRIVDRPLVVGSAARLHAATGWTPVIPLEQSLRDVLDDCRARLGEA